MYNELVGGERLAGVTLNLGCCMSFTSLFVDRGGTGVEFLPAVDRLQRSALSEFYFIFHVLIYLCTGCLGPGGWGGGMHCFHALDFQQGPRFQFFGKLEHNSILWEAGV